MNWSELFERAEGHDVTLEDIESTLSTVRGKDAKDA